MASLSEAVFKWKGFILDGLTFYRQWIATPILHALSSVLPLAVPPTFVDHLTVVMLLLGGQLRGIFFRQKNRYARIAISAIPVTANVAYLFVVAQAGPAKFPASAALQFFGLSFLFGYFLYRGASRLLWVVYVLLPPFVVAALAAINAGLARSAA